MCPKMWLTCSLSKVTRLNLFGNMSSGSPDQIVATASEELQAVLVSFDGDFETISPRVAKGQRRRFRKLSRIWMRCSEPQAAQRLLKGLDFVVREFALTTPSTPMRLTIGGSYLRTDR